MQTSAETEQLHPELLVIAGKRSLKIPFPNTSYWKYSIHTHCKAPLPTAGANWFKNDKFRDSSSITGPCQGKAGAHLSSISGCWESDGEHSQVCGPSFKSIFHYCGQRCSSALDVPWGRDSWALFMFTCNACYISQLYQCPLEGTILKLR